MTTLPVLAGSYEEAMIRDAVSMVERVEHMLTEDASEYIATMMCQRLRRGLSERRKVIEAAEAGDVLSHTILMREFHELLDVGQMPPASLRDYAARTDKHPKRGRGRVWYEDFRRNQGFMILMALTAEANGLEPTRNQATKRPCGASIAAAALQRRGFKRVSERYLAELWRLWGDSTIATIALTRAWPELIPQLRSLRILKP